MKKEDLIQAIDNIQPDVHLKTRLKAKVFSAENKRKKTKNIPKIVVALCLAVAIILGAGLFTAPQTDGNLPDEASPQMFVPEIMKAFVVIAGAAEGEAEAAQPAVQALELNRKYSYGVHLKIADTRSLSDEEKTELLKEMNDTVFQYSKGSGFSLGRSMTCEGDGFYLTYCSVNEFRLNPENPEKIKAITVSNTSEYGNMVYDAHKPTFKIPEHGHSITISAEDFDFEASGFYWNITEEAEKAIEKNINLPFSAFNDTITFTADYIDGSKATAVVELNFDGSGNATAVCREYTFVNSN